MVTHLEGKKNRMGFGAQTDCSRSLLYGLECIFDLVQTSLGRKDGVVGVISVPELCMASKHTSRRVV